MGAEVFYQRRSCQEIASVYPEANSGEYYITTFDAGAREFARTLVWCYMDKTAQTKGYTFFAMQAATAVKPFDTTTPNDDCHGKGLEMLDFDALPVDVQQAVVDKYGTVANTFFPPDFTTNAYVLPSDFKTDDIICSTNDANVDYSASSNGVLQHTLPDGTNQAERGRFVIEYHVKDRAGLANCEPAKRTVIVKDTLQDAKVLTVQQLNDRMNTAYADSLMAEESPATASNGWVIGAAASAVTGLALLGFSQRKTIVTTVPV